MLMPCVYMTGFLTGFRVSSLPKLAGQQAWDPLLFACPMLIQAHTAMVGFLMRVLGDQTWMLTLAR